MVSYVVSLRMHGCLGFLDHYKWKSFLLCTQERASKEIPKQQEFKEFLVGLPRTRKTIKLSQTASLPLQISEEPARIEILKVEKDVFGNRKSASREEIPHWGGCFLVLGIKRHPELFQISNPPACTAES